MKIRIVGFYDGKKYYEVRDKEKISHALGGEQMIKYVHDARKRGEVIEFTDVDGIKMIDTISLRDAGE